MKIARGRKQNEMEKNTTAQFYTFLELCLMCTLQAEITRRTHSNKLHVQARKVILGSGVGLNTS